MLEHRTNNTEIKRDDLGSHSGIQAPATLLYPYMDECTNDCVKKPLEDNNLIVPQSHCKAENVVYTSTMHGA